VRTYEALFIVRPDLGDEEIQAVADKYQAMVTDQGGVIVRSEIWGKRKLAYEVKHFTEGVYVLLRFEAESDFVAKLEGQFRLSEQVIRFLVTYFDENTLKLEAEQQIRKQAELQASAESESGRGRPRRGSRDDDDDDEDDD
jgi:small subunit ribosomal protein S6